MCKSPPGSLICPQWGGGASQTIKTGRQGRLEDSIISPLLVFLQSQFVIREVVILPLAFPAMTLCCCPWLRRQDSDSSSKTNGSGRTPTRSTHVQDPIPTSDGTRVAEGQAGPSQQQEPSPEPPSSPIPVELEGQCTDNAATTSTVFPEHPFPSSPAKMNLCERIIDEAIENTGKSKFVPADAIEALSSRPVVEAELRNHATGDLLNSLVDYVVEGRAAKVFLTLAVNDKTKLMKELYGSGLCDVHLPLEKDTTKKDEAAVRPVNEKIPFPTDWKPFHHWNRKERFDFYENQWLFLAPVFIKDIFSYKLPKRCPLPFISEDLDHRGGLAGSVNEVGVHEAHQKVLAKMGHYFLQEQETLRIIRNIKNDHLIMPIASYSYHNEESGFFLFPWAEGGNLREFWSAETIRPLKDSKMMSWALKQMCGLCQALSILHDRGRRHGDLKPENILLFHEGEYQRMLKIALIMFK
ncbi:serine threonine kinase, partial [Fusarium albosuccineum]